MLFREQLRNVLLAHRHAGAAGRLIVCFFHPRRRIILLKRGVFREAQLVVAVLVSLVEDPAGCGILRRAGESELVTRANRRGFGMGRRTPFSILSSLSCADSASTRPSSSESLVREAMSIERASKEHRARGGPDSQVWQPYRVQDPDVR